MTTDQIDKALDAWLNTDLRLRQIADDVDVNYNSLRSAMERARIDGDPRAISSDERRRRIALRREPPPVGRRGITLAEWIGIRVGPTVCRTEYSLTGFTIRENWITLSGGLISAEVA